MTTNIALLAALLLAPPAALHAAGDPTANLHAIVTIATDAPSVAYSRMIFGGFLEHFDRQIYGGVFEPGSALSDTNGFRTDVVAALKELKVPVVRWPGGCFVSGYHWKTGVGKNRKPTDDMAWGVREPNTFGTDEFVKLSRLIGWQPYICNNAGNGTIEEMRNWVEYCNGSTGKFAQLRKDNGYTEPRNVKIWSVGNENWGQHEIGYKPIEQWAPLVLEAAKAMKTADPHIQLSAAALPSKAWTLPLLKIAGQYLHIVDRRARQEVTPHQPGLRGIPFVSLCCCPAFRRIGGIQPVHWRQQQRGEKQNCEFVHIFILIELLS